MIRQTVSLAIIKITIGTVIAVYVRKCGSNLFIVWRINHRVPSISKNFHTRIIVARFFRRTAIFPRPRLNYLWFAICIFHQLLLTALY
ncbi:unnamed protein product [Callosobruchus maculatus]|uniref:Uncharacterized protein n=1 Tax=Callosobruchus maculatus TaxID=64391 RepID=A0A653CB83_CALMS|nr:unnamed protein product [Callosobruchus maculatus]